MVSFTTMISTLFNSQGVIALISIVFLIGCGIIVGLSPIIEFVNPASMIKHAIEVLITVSVNSNALSIMLIALVWITKKIQ